MLPNFVLIGFMGCGKSSVGRRLAAMTGHRFIDTDEVVVQTEKRSISEIFSTKGEAYFRDVEAYILKEFVGVCGVILATGGGIILREANRTTLHKIGIVAWIDANPDIIFQRATRTQKRPLLQTKDPRASFDELLESRRGLYETVADFRIDSTDLNHDEVAQTLLDQAMRHHARYF